MRLARSAGVPDPEIGWRLVQPPTFDNQFATIELEGRKARLRIERTVRDDPDGHQHRDVARARAGVGRVAGPLRLSAWRTRATRSRTGC